MTDSAIALSIFGGDKAVLTTDVAAGVHTLKVTSANPTDGIVVPGFGATKYVIGTVKTSGVHTLCVTTSAANAAIALPGAGGDKILIATVLSAGVHVIAVTSSAATSAISIDSFGSGVTTLGTAQSGGVHTLAVTTAPNDGFAISSFAAGESVMAAAKSGNVYSLAVSGLQDAEAAAYFAAAGIGDPARMDRINTFFVGLKSTLGMSSVKDRLDYLYFRASPPSMAGALVDATGNGFNGTAINSPSQTTGLGVQGNGSTSYIKNNYKPSTQAVRCTLHNASVFSYVSSLSMASGVSAGCAVGVNQTVNIIIFPHYTSDRFTYALNNAGGGSQVGGATSQTGLFAIDLLDDTPNPKVTPYLDGVAQAAAVAQNTVNLPAADLSSLAFNNSDSSRTDFFKGAVAFEMCGGHFTASEHASIAALVATLAAGGW